MTQRALVLVDLMQQEQNLEPFINKNNWQLIRCNSVGSVSKSIELHQPALGLLVIPRDVNAHQLRALRECLEQHAAMQWHMIVAPRLAQDPDIRELILMYCADYHTFPVSNERLMLILGHAAGMAELCKHQNPAMCASIDDKDYPFIGESVEIQRLKSRINKIAHTDAPVLIIGESGTGKELVAKSIHKRSHRRDKPLVALNCGALPDNLVQSELFGHEKGAFTGALQKKIGRVEQADGGTLFMDEVGDLPLSQQVYFLRFLQEGTFERVGGNETITVNTRVIAATHVNLEQAIHSGNFREDFYYRLNVAPIFIPPLRERPGDVELLAHFFLERYSSRYNQKLCGFSKKAIHAMRHHPWPGNVRELINRICRATMFSDRRLLTDNDLGLSNRTDTSASLAHARDTAEKESIEKALNRSNNNITAAARHLKVSRLTLYRLMDKHAIKDQRNTKGASKDCAIQ